jgi:hypothetical protein
MSFQVQIRNMNGESSVTLSEGESLADALEKAGVAAGCTVRHNGERVDAASSPEPGGTYVTAPADAKHGVR